MPKTEGREGGRNKGKERMRKKKNRTERRQKNDWKEGTIRAERKEKIVEVTSSALSDACSC